MLAKTTSEKHAERHVQLPMTWLVLLVSLLAVIATTIVVTGWQGWTPEASSRPADRHAAPAPSPAPMAAAFARLVAA